jgi:pimeloyl-ACP methyl ester carboxylesterase
LRDEYFDSAGVRVRYVERGRGEPVVLVHSYTSDLEDQWVKPGTLDTLAQSYRVVAFDLRGHGKSDKPHQPQAYGPELAWDIVRLLDYLGIDKAHVVGYSLGAHIIAQLLTLAPQRLKSAVLGGGAGRRNWTEEDARRAEVEAAEMEQGLLTTQLTRLRQPPPSRKEIEELSARYLNGKDRYALAAIRRSNAAQVVSAEQIASAAVPVLAVVGSEDPYRGSVEALKEAMPELRTVVIDGATHFAASTRREFVDAAATFIAEVSEARRESR